MASLCQDGPKGSTAFVDNFGRLHFGDRPRLPSGARTVLSAFEVGDYLLLLEAIGPGGSFAYVGRAIAKPPQECFRLISPPLGRTTVPANRFSERASDELPLAQVLREPGLQYKLEPGRADLPHSARAAHYISIFR